MMRKLFLILCLVITVGCSSPSTVVNNNSEEEDGDSYACRYLDYYNYDNPVPYSMGIEESYYDHTLFAGDSRMGSISLYGSHPNAHVAYVTSLNLLLIESMQVDEVEEELTLYDVLSTTDKQNIYLLFGINEIRSKSFDIFAEKYDEIVKMLLANNPSANIYVMLAYHPDYISNLPEPALSIQVQDLNDHLIAIAKNNHVFYLDLDNGLDDEEYTIKDEYVWDGLHFNPTGTKALEDYIATHVVRRDWYVKEVCE